MPRFMKTQSDFGKGEVAPDFCARGIAGALSELTNAEVLASGAIARRRGLSEIAELASADSVLAPFGGEYLLSISAGEIRIYKDNAPHQVVAASFGGDVRRLRWAQRMDEMIFVRDDMPPKVLRKTGAAFSLADFQFETDQWWMPILPMMRYPETDGVTISLSASGNGTNWAYITASAPVFGDGSVGGELCFMSRRWTISGFVNATKVLAYTSESFTMPSTSFRDWTESAFSNHRGWPSSAAFFQDRLVFGGCRAWPCGLWFSRTGRHRNFDAGTGLDDQAIFITLLADAQQKIQNLAAARDLIVMTDSGEWAVSANPLTPSSISVRQHSGIGTATGRFVAPQKIGAGTAFAAAGGGIVQTALDELGENYAATDLSMTARHIVDSPVSMAWSDARSQLLAVMENGEIAAMTLVPALGVSAWARFCTAGEFKSVAVVGRETYAIVLRGDDVFIESFSDDSIEDFSFRVASAPLSADGHHPRRVRVSRVSARIENARRIKLSGRDFYFATPYSGDADAMVLGTGDSSEPLWTIESGEPHPVKILSATAEGNYEL